MEDISRQLTDIQTALRQQQRATARMERRLGATWGCAFVGIVGAFVLGLSPEARAQFGVTLGNLNVRLTAVETKTQFVSVSDGQMFVTGTNLHIRSGSGTTDGVVNGRGNLIIGYNEVSASGDDRSGSHNMVLGNFHDYSSYGGLVVGQNNRILGPFASVSGGQFNTARGDFASVGGGDDNTANGNGSAVIVFVNSVEGTCNDENKRPPKCQESKRWL